MCLLLLMLQWAAAAFILFVHPAAGFVAFSSRLLTRPGPAAASSFCLSSSAGVDRSVGSPSEFFKGYAQPETKRGAFEAAREDALEKGILLPCVILVNPFLDQNVGSVSRAMLNFGLTELRVVDPRCDILSDQALALAVGSADILKNAKTFPTLEAAIGDLERVFATTIRPRHMTQMVLSPEACAEQAVTRAAPATITAGATMAIVFGRERSGLTNEEVALADTVVTIDTFRQFSSINLAQAVNIVGYELFKRRIALEGAAPPEGGWLHPRDGERMARREDLENLFARLEEKLTERSYQPEPHRRELNYRNIRNILQRTLVTTSEVDLLHGVLTSLVKKT